MRTRSDVTRECITLLIAMLVSSFVTAGALSFLNKTPKRTSKPSVVVTVPTHGVQEELQALRNADPVALRPTDPNRVLLADVMTLKGLEKLPVLEFNKGIYDEKGKPTPSVLPEDVVLIIRTADGRRWVSRWDPLPQY